MKSKTTKPRLTIADAVYTAIHQLDGAEENEIIDRASKLCGKMVTPDAFNRALRSFDSRGVAKQPRAIHA